MKTNIRYRANNGKYAKTHSFVIWGWLFLVVLSILLAISAYERYINDLQSPQADKLSMVPQVQAAESVRIDCNTPRGYLECKRAKGEITLDQQINIEKIIQCESGWNPNAINTKNKNGSFDAGIVQINSIHKDISNADKFDYKKSIDWMVKKVNKQGFGAWRSSIKCHKVK